MSSSSPARSSDPEIDLTTCDREPIHIPGSVQGHGVLLTLSEPDLLVQQISTNTAVLLGTPPEAILGQTLAQLLEPDTLSTWLTTVINNKLERLDSTPVYLSPFRLLSSGLLEGSIHRHDKVLLLQVEPAASEDPRLPQDSFNRVQKLLAELHAATPFQNFCDVAARQVRQFTGYHRVVIYKFLEDDCGEVIAESKVDQLTSWLGLRYPASDIPKQARALYLKSLLRIIPDVKGSLAGLIPLLNPATNAPLDMSYCVLRSVSPVHIEYLGNIGAAASMSLSIISKGKLWGLIACHHGAPRFVPQQPRIACEFLAHMMSLQMSDKEEAQTSENRLELVSLQERLVPEMAHADRFQDAIAANQDETLSAFRATGGAVIIRDDVFLMGAPPSQPQLSLLAAWLRNTAKTDLFSTNQLSALFPQAAEYASLASGVLAIRLSRNYPDYVFWFRPEAARVVHWAGDPSKVVEASLAPENHQGLRLSPRKSFESWKQTVRGQSNPWTPQEKEAALHLRKAILEVIAEKANKTAALNRELQRSNIELESFAYVASHDLKEPLHGISNYSHLLQRSATSRLTDHDRSKLDAVIRLTKRMDGLIDALLYYSRIGRGELIRKPSDLNRVVAEALDVLTSRIREQSIDIRLATPLPTIPCDALQVSEIYTNLISNAIKYNDKPLKSVEIGWRQSDIPVFYVRDNGIGIEAGHFEKIFQIFRRLHARDAYGGGAGAGLTIVSKLVQRHGGRIWVESEPGIGSCFCFTLQGLGD